MRFVVVEHAALAGDLVDMRAFRKHLARQPPDLSERLVVQLEAAVRREHRHTLLQAVQRFPLHVDHGVEAAFQGEALRDVVEQIGDAAIWAQLGRDVDGAAIEQVPPVLVLVAVAERGQHFGLPIAIVRHLRQARKAAQPVERFFDRRIAREPVDVEFPDAAIGIVEEGEALVAAVDGDARCHAMQRAVIGGGATGRLDLGVFQASTSMATPAVAASSAMIDTS